MKFFIGPTIIFAILYLFKPFMWQVGMGALELFLWSILISVGSGLAIFVSLLFLMGLIMAISARSDR